MPNFTYASPEGKIVTVESEQPLSERDLDELFSTPEVADRELTRYEYGEKRRYDKEYGNTSAMDYVQGFASGLAGMAKSMADATVESVKNLGSAKGWKENVISGVEGIGRGSVDTYMLASDALGSLGDNWTRWTEGAEAEIDREYDRYLNNYIWNKERMTNFGENVIKKGDKEYINDAIAEGAAVFEPVGTLIPIGTVGKFITKGTRKAAKKTLEKGSVAAKYVEGKTDTLGTKIEGAKEGLSEKAKEALGEKLAPVATGITTGTLTLAERLTAGAGWASSVSGDVMEAFASPSTLQRGLQRLASDKDLLSKYPYLKKKAAQAHEYAGTRVGDAMFKSMMDSVTIGGSQAVLAAIAGRSAEEVGGAAASGALGLLTGMVGSEGAGLDVSPTRQKSLFGKAIDKARGRKPDDVILSERGESTIAQFMSQIHNDAQLAEFKKLPKYAQVIQSIMETSNLSKGVRVRFLDNKTHRDIYQDTGFNDLNKDVQLSDSEAGFMADMADMSKAMNEYKKQNKEVPNSYYNAETKTIFVNKDVAKGKTVNELTSNLLHEYAHPIVHDMMASNPYMSDKVIDPFLAKDNEIGVPYLLDGKTVMFKPEFDDFRIKYENAGGVINADARVLAGEIIAENFAMMFTDNLGNINKLGYQGKGFISDIAEKVSESLGLIDRAGNRLDNPISKELRKSSKVQNLLRNHAKLKRQYIDAKDKLLRKDYDKIVPKDNETSASAFNRRHSKGGSDASEINIQDVKDFMDISWTLGGLGGKRASESRNKARGWSLSQFDSDPYYMGLGRDNSGRQISPDVIAWYESKLGADNDMVKVMKLLNEGIDNQVKFNISTLTERSIFGTNDRKLKGQLRAKPNTVQNAMAQGNIPISDLRTPKEKPASAFRSLTDDARDIEANLIDFSTSKDGEISVGVAEQRLIEHNLDKLKAYGIIKSKKDTRQQINDVLDTIKRAVEENKKLPLSKRKSLEEANMINDEIVVALMGYPGAKDVINKNQKLKRFLQENTLKNAYRKIRLDRIQNMVVPHQDRGINLTIPNVKFNQNPKF